MSQDPVRDAGGAGQAQVAQQGDRWLLDAKQHRDGFVKRFEASLNQISAAVSEQQNDRWILIRHVDAAYGALARAGFSQVSWVNKPENETAFGGAIIGAGIAANDILTIFIKDEQALATVRVFWFIFFFVLGFALYFHGLYRGSLQDGRPTWWSRLGDGISSAVLWLVAPVRRSTTTSLEAALLIALCIGFLMWRNERNTWNGERSAWANDRSSLEKTISQQKAAQAKAAKTATTHPPISGTIKAIAAATPTAKAGTVLVSVTGDLVLQMESTSFSYSVVPIGADGGSYRISPKATPVPGP